jgi:flagellar biogenesis protein FliO
MNGVSAWNTTFQTLPAINGTIKTTTTVYSTSQFNFLVTLYAVIQYMLLFIAIMLVLIWVIRYFGLLKNIIRPPKERNYG